MIASLAHRDVLSRAASGCQSYLEIGVQEGGSLETVMVAAPYMDRLLLCDTWDRRHGGTGRGNHDHISALLERLNYQGEVVFLDGRSQDLLPFYRRSGAHRRFDLSHVDGSHDLDDVVMDLHNAWILTAKRMVVHDIAFPQVWQAVREFGARQDAEARVTFGDYGSVVFERRKV